MQIRRLAVSKLWCSQIVADLIVEIEELELHFRCRGRSNLRKFRIATISVRMVEEVLLASRTMWCVGQLAPPNCAETLSAGNSLTNLVMRRLLN